MEYKKTADSIYLGIPVQAGRTEERLEIFCKEKKLFEFQVPAPSDGAEQTYDYYGYLKVKEYLGSELTFRGNFPEGFFEAICFCGSAEYEPIARPLLHYTAERGWINDPNGLVWHDGVFELFYQYNPVNTAWQNMSWGHAVSADLLHFTRKDTALFPNADGAAYSGCGLVNERGLLGLPKDALLFFYTAAGGNDRWSENADFTQRLAYSTDGGETLVRAPGTIIGKIGADSRDPKIFWHEETKAYVMVLWIQGNEFGIFRSKDLKNWERSSSIVLKDAWECPDLFALDLEGERVWVFMSADGFYFLGDFDGYTFRTDGVQRHAYMCGLPYAAQTYSGVKDRVIAVPWLRTHNVGKPYTGMMGLPRELGLVKTGGERMLSMLPIREYENSKTEVLLSVNRENPKTVYSAAITRDAAAEIVLKPRRGEIITIHAFAQEIQLRDNILFYRSERTVFPEGVSDMRILIDRGILEICANRGTRNTYYETDLDDLKGNIVISGCQNEAKLYLWRP